MNDFVEQCREEWRRLGVPLPLAEEMAADLESDLREAGAEGVAAEELLGSSYADPRGFAASGRPNAGSSRSGHPAAAAIADRLSWSRSPLWR